MTDRRSYRKLAEMTAWGLYDGRKLIATVRAPDKLAAGVIFYRHGHRSGDVREIKKKT